MALSKEFVVIGMSANYVRITEMQFFGGAKDFLTVSVGIYASLKHRNTPGSQPLATMGPFQVAYDPAEGKASALSQVYTGLKALPEFSGAVDA